MEERSGETDVRNGAGGAVSIWRALRHVGEDKGYRWNFFRYKSIIGDGLRARSPAGAGE